MPKEIKFKNYILPLLLFILLILSFLIIKPFVLAIALGGLLAYVTYPLYHLISKRVPRKSLAAIMVCILVLLVFIIPAIFFIKVLVQQTYAFFLMIKDQPIDPFSNCQNTLCLNLQHLITNPAVQIQIQGLGKAVASWIIQKGTAFLAGIAKMMLNTMVFFFSLFYFLKDGKVLFQRILLSLSISEEQYHSIFTRLKEIINGVVYGYLLMALFQGILGGIGFFFFGLPSPFLWGLVTAIAALIPVVGTALVWIPAAAILVLEGVFQDSTGLMIKGIGFFLYGLIIISGLDNLLRPKLIGGTAKVHPAIIFLGTLGGMFIFGPLGVILGPLILALTEVAAKLYVAEKP